MNAYRIKNVADINRKTLPEDTDPEFEFKYIDISSVGSDGKITIPDKTTTFFSAPSRARRIAPEGSVIVSTVRTYLRAITTVPPSHEPLVFSTGFAILEATSGVDKRFLGYHCRSQHFIDEITARSTGVSYPAINPSEIGDLPIRLPSLEEQRRIADFLDAETARIDSLTAARQKMASLLALKRDRLIEAYLQIDSTAHGIAFSPLKYLAAEVTVGIVITPAKWYVTSGGVPALRGTNVRPGKISADSLVRISNAGHLENRKSRLRSGDVVVVRTGQAGSAAVVPPALDGANCIDLIIVRPGPKLFPRYLEYVLNSSYARRHVEEHSTGSIQAHFNVGAMKQVPIPSISRQHQERLVTVIDDATARIDRLNKRIQDQTTLLVERRRALITAAVTGQFDVSTASGRGVAD